MAAGKDVEDVKKKMAALFKTSVDKIDPLFKKPGIILKRDLDLATAKKYARAIEATGALCRIDPPEPEIKSSPTEVVRVPRAAESPAEPQVVVIALSAKPDPRFSPQVCQKLTGSADHLNFNEMDVPEIAMDQLVAMAVFSETEKNKDITKVMMFTKLSRRPFNCDINSIAYSDFLDPVGASTMASFRGFLYFLCRKNPSVIIEESTLDFLSGSTPQKLDQNKVQKLATGIGNLLESGDIAAQT